MKAFIVDAFATRAFAGNPAAVCLVETDLCEEVMLSVAQEFNLSETAFIGSTDIPSRYSIRCFSPKQEIPLCGHATLGSARVIFAISSLTAATFVTGEGVEINVCAVGDQLEMILPSYATDSAEAPAALLSALGIGSVVNTEYNPQTRILLLEIKSVSELSALRPDFGALRRSHDSINGVLVTARCSSGEHDFPSRYFWPWSGGDEDPVTGGIHTFLAGYWAQRLGKDRMRSYQSSRRGGSMEVELCTQGVKLRTSAVIVFEGTMRSSVLESARELGR
ncbi:MAG: PhzF family phenazine biosynthesis protein [Phycisphaerae bacterium]